MSASQMQDMVASRKGKTMPKKNLAAGLPLAETSNGAPLSGHEKCTPVKAGTLELKHEHPGRTETNGGKAGTAEKKTTSKRAVPKKTPIKGFAAWGIDTVEENNDARLRVSIMQSPPNMIHLVWRVEQLDYNSTKCHVEKVSVCRLVDWLYAYH